MITNVQFFFVLVVLTCATGACGWGDTLHALFLADTDDPSIGNGMAISSRNISSLLNELCDFAGMRKNFIQIQGGELKRQRVDECLENLAVSGDDAVFFYYNGHGCAGTSQWPALGFDNSLLDLNEVLKRLCSKKPRLLVVLADCCNVVLGPEQGLEGAARPGKTPTETIRKEARILLLDHAGLFIGCSASKGESSWGEGFTNELTYRLFREAISAHPRWYGVCIDQISVSDLSLQFSVYVDS